MIVLEEGEDEADLSNIAGVGVSSIRVVRERQSDSAKLTLFVPAILRLHIYLFTHCYFAPFFFVIRFFRSLNAVT